MQFFQKVNRAHEKVLAGTFAPGNGLATPGLSVLIEKTIFGILKLAKLLCFTGCDNVIR